MGGGEGEARDYAGYLGHFKDFVFYCEIGIYWIRGATGYGLMA